MIHKPQKNSHYATTRYVLNNGIADFVLTGGVVGHVFLVAMGFDLGKKNMAS